MANSDSFINEVTEEVRRDRLFSLIRRWAWLAVLIVLILVGIAAFAELRRAQNETRSQAFGDAVLGALDTDTLEVQAERLQAITPEGPGAEMLLALLSAGTQAEAGDRAEAAARLREMSERSDLPERYRDLAYLKAHLIAPEEAAAAAARLDQMARPGAPYRPLAIEQQAYLRFAEGDVEGGVALLEEIAVDASASPGLQQRAQQAITALEGGARLSDTPPAAPETSPLFLPPVGGASISAATGGAAETDEEAGAGSDAASDTDPAAEPTAEDSTETQAGSDAATEPGPATEDDPQTDGAPEAETEAEPQTE